MFSILQGGKCVVQSTSLIQLTLREGTALPLPTRPLVSYERTQKMIVLTIQLIIKMWALPHRMGEHSKISPSHKYIHEANRYVQATWFGCLVNQTAIYTPRNDHDAVCILCHSFGSCYGKFYAFYLPHVKSILFANVYNFTSNNVL